MEIIVQICAAPGRKHNALSRRQPSLVEAAQEMGVRLQSIASDTVGPSEQQSFRVEVQSQAEAVPILD